jgi:hypothetical protein
MPVPPPSAGGPTDATLAPLLLRRKNWAAACPTAELFEPEPVEDTRRRKAGGAPEASLRLRRSIVPEPSALNLLPQATVRVHASLATKDTHQKTDSR